MRGCQAKASVHAIQFQDSLIDQIQFLRQDSSQPQEPSHVGTDQISMLRRTMKTVHKPIFLLNQLSPANRTQPELSSIHSHKNQLVSTGVPKKIPETSLNIKSERFETESNGAVVRDSCGLLIVPLDTKSRVSLKLQRKQRMSRVQGQLKQNRDRQSKSGTEIGAIKQELYSLQGQFHKKQSQRLAQFPDQYIETKVTNGLLNSLIDRNNSRSQCVGECRVPIQLCIPILKLNKHRRDQLTCRKGTLHQNKIIEMGYVVTCSDSLRICIYYTFSQPVTVFKVAISSPNPKVLDPNSFTTCKIPPHLQNRLSLRILPPTEDQLPFATPQLLGSYVVNDLEHTFVLLLPCFLINFVYTTQAQLPSVDPKYVVPAAKLSKQYMTVEALRQVLPGISDLGLDSGLWRLGVRVRMGSWDIYLLIKINKDLLTLDIFELKYHPYTQLFLESYLQELLSILSSHN